MLQNFALTINLPPDQLEAVAREAKEKMLPEEWARLVGFALEVIRLEEACQTEVEYLVVPRSVGG